jgi:hypothetical protein
MTEERAREAVGIRSHAEAREKGFRFIRKDLAYDLHEPVFPLEISKSPLSKTGFMFRAAGTANHYRDLYDKRAGE